MPPHVAPALPAAGRWSAAVPQHPQTPMCQPLDFQALLGDKGCMLLLYAVLLLPTGIWLHLTSSAAWLLCLCVAQPGAAGGWRTTCSADWPSCNPAARVWSEGCQLRVLVLPACTRVQLAGSFGWRSKAEQAAERHEAVRCVCCADLRVLRVLRVHQVGRRAASSAVLHSVQATMKSTWKKALHEMAQGPTLQPL